MAWGSEHDVSYEGLVGRAVSRSKGMYERRYTYGSHGLVRRKNGIDTVHSTSVWVGSPWGKGRQKSHWAASQRLGERTQELRIGALPVREGRKAPSPSLAKVGASLVIVCVSPEFALQAPVVPHSGLSLRFVVLELLRAHKSFPQLW